IASITKFTKRILKYFSWTLDKLLKTLSNVLGTDLSWVKKILNGWIDPNIKFLDNAVAYSERVLKSAVRKLTRVIARLFEPLVRPVMLFTNIMKDAVRTFMELLIMRPFYELYGRAIVGAQFAYENRNSGMDDASRLVWRDMDVYDFNLIKDLSITYFHGKRKCEYCGRYHLVAEGTKLVPDMVELWLRAKKLLGYEDPMAHVLMSTRMLCEVTVDGEKKLLWIEVGNIKFEKTDDRYELKYAYERGKFRDIDKPLGIVRRIMLTYWINDDGGIIVTPVVQIIVSDWADQSKLKEIKSELNKYGTVKQIEYRRERD
ncbi:MAG: hypothetical protein DRI99_03430, partial [Candidatus Aminicenantes bacterium]